MSDQGSMPPPPPPPPPSGGGGYGAPPPGGGYGPPPPGGGYGAPQGAPPPNHLVWAILTTLFCCLPFGIVSIVFAAQVNSKWAAGDVAGAHESSQKARRWAMVSAIVGIVVIGLYLVVVMVYVALVGEPEQDDFADDLGPLWIQILLIAIAAPIGEEVCFRGMLFGGLRERLPMWAAGLISAALFGLLHVTTGISVVPPLISFGFLLALVYERTGSILPCILLHMLNNSVALLAQ